MQKAIKDSMKYQYAFIIFFSAFNMLAMQNPKEIKQLPSTQSFSFMTLKDDNFAKFEKYFNKKYLFDLKGLWIEQLPFVKERLIADKESLGLMKGEIEALLNYSNAQKEEVTIKKEYLYKATGYFALAGISLSAFYCAIQKGETFSFITKLLNYIPSKIKNLAFGTSFLSTFYLGGKSLYKRTHFDLEANKAELRKIRTIVSNILDTIEN